MKYVVNDLMDKVYLICDDYVREAETKIKRIIANLEELVNLEVSFNKKSKVLVEDAVNKLNDTKRESLYTDFQKIVNKSNEILRVESDHLSMVLINVVKNYDETEEIGKLNRYVGWNKEIVKNIRSSFQEVATYVKFLQDNYKERLSEKHLIKISKEIRETVEFMNSFYNGGYQEMLKIEEEAKKLKPSSKR